MNQALLTFAQVARETTQEEIVGKPFWEFPSWQLTPELTKVAKTAVAQAAAGNFFCTEVTLNCATDQPHPLLHRLDLSLKPVYISNSDQIVWLIAEGRDITTHITRQRELERLKRAFISIVSHEIRTPLSSIRGALELVAAGFKSAGIRTGRPPMSMVQCGDTGDQIQEKPTREAYKRSPAQRRDDSLREEKLFESRNLVKHQNSRNVRMRVLSFFSN